MSNPYSKGEVDYDDIPDCMNDEYVDEFNNSEEMLNGMSYAEYEEIRCIEDYS